MSNDVDVSVESERLFRERLAASHAKTDRLFAVLMVAQWLLAVLLAVTVAPFGWEGKQQTVHAHVLAAFAIGTPLSAFPIALALLRPSWFGTRVVIAISQMLWSALLIHLTGGRIETHFHVFGSLAFVAFYRDWRVVLIGTVVVVVDHLLRGLLWPESVYGIQDPEWWRFLEHAAWVVFEDVVLVFACVRGVDEMRALARHETELAVLAARDLEREARALQRAEAALRESQAAQARSARLATVGGLAANVGHELRNPLATMRNATHYVKKKLTTSPASAPDPKVGEFLGIVDREIEACSKIVSDLLDFARERVAELRPCALRSIVVDAIRDVRPRAEITVRNEVSEQVLLEVDPLLMRQAITNVVQNAVEAAAAVVVVEAVEGAGVCVVRVRDDGPGVDGDVAAKVFEPLFTTKLKGIGLGLAITKNVVSIHGGTVSFSSTMGQGTVVELVLPLREAQKKVA